MLQDRGSSLLRRAEVAAGGAALSALETKPGRVIAGTAAGKAAKAKLQPKRTGRRRLLLLLALAGGAAAFSAVRRSRASAQPDPLFDAAMTNPAPARAGTPASSPTTAPATGTPTVEPLAATSSIDPATAAAATAGSAPEVKVVPGAPAGGTAAGSPLAGVADGDAAAVADTTEQPARAADASGELGTGDGSQA